MKEGRHMFLGKHIYRKEGRCSWEGVLYYRKEGCQVFLGRKEDVPGKPQCILMRKASVPLKA